MRAVVACFDRNRDGHDTACGKPALANGGSRHRRIATADVTRAPPAYAGVVNRDQHDAKRPVSAKRSLAVAALLAGGVLALGILSGCSRKAGGFADENDRLAFELEQTEAALEQVRRERTELRAKLNELAARLEAAEGEGVSAVIEAMPRVSALEFERLTSFVDRDDEPGFEAIDVYVRPLDGRGRFVQAAGTLRVDAFLQPTEAAGERVLLASRTLGPRELRDAYRSTLLSVHYSIPLTLPEPLAEERADRRGNGAVLLIARFDDAVTGLSHTATRELR